MGNGFPDEELLIQGYSCKSYTYLNSGGRECQWMLLPLKAKSKHNFDSEL